MKYTNLFVEVKETLDLLVNAQNYVSAFNILAMLVKAHKSTELGTIIYHGITEFDIYNEFDAHEHYYFSNSLSSCINEFYHEVGSNDNVRIVDAFQKMAINCLGGYFTKIKGVVYLFHKDSGLLINGILYGTNDAGNKTLKVRAYKVRSALQLFMRSTRNFHRCIANFESSIDEIVIRSDDESDVAYRSKFNSFN